MRDDYLVSIASGYALDSKSMPIDPQQYLWPNNEAGELLVCGSSRASCHELWKIWASDIIPHLAESYTDNVCPSHSKLALVVIARDRDPYIGQCAISPCAIEALSSSGIPAAIILDRSRLQHKCDVNDVCKIGFDEININAGILCLNAESSPIRAYTTATCLRQAVQATAPTVHGVDLDVLPPIGSFYPRGSLMVSVTINLDANYGRGLEADDYICTWLSALSATSQQRDIYARKAITIGLGMSPRSGYGAGDGRLVPSAIILGNKFLSHAAAYGQDVYIDFY